MKRHWSSLPVLRLRDHVLVSVSGMVGLKAVLCARQAKRRVLLANKEALEPVAPW